MLYDVYTGLVVQRSHYTHIVTTHHPHTITIITTYPKREQETQSQQQPPHRKADTEEMNSTKVQNPRHNCTLAKWEMLSSIS